MIIILIIIIFYKIVKRGVEGAEILLDTDRSDLWRILSRWIVEIDLYKSSSWLV